MQTPKANHEADDRRNVKYKHHPSSLIRASPDYRHPFLQAEDHSHIDLDSGNDAGKREPYDWGECLRKICSIQLGDSMDERLAIRED